MSSVSFPTVLSELFRCLSPFITEPEPSSVCLSRSEADPPSHFHFLEKEEEKEGDKKENILFCTSEKSLKKDLDNLYGSSLLRSSHDHCCPPVCGFGAAPLSWKPHLPDSTISLLPIYPYHNDRLGFLRSISTHQKRLERWMKAVEGKQHHSGNACLDLPVSIVLDCSDSDLNKEADNIEAEEEEEEEAGDVVVSYFSKYSFSLCKLCSRGTSCMVRELPACCEGNPHIRLHGGGAAGDALDDGSHSYGWLKGKMPPYFLYILHPHHHHNDPPFYLASKDSVSIPLTNAQRVQEISTLVSLLHRPRLAYEGNPAFALFWRSVLEQQVGAQLLSALVESWEMWKKTCGVTMGGTSTQASACSSSTTRTMPSHVYSERCMLYAEALLFYAKHRVEELFEADGYFSSPFACNPTRHQHSNNGDGESPWFSGDAPAAAGVTRDEKGIGEDGFKHKQRASQGSSLRNEHKHKDNCWEVKEEKLDVVLVPGEDSDALLHRIFQLLCEFSEAKAGESFQRRVALLLLGVLCLWNRITPLLYSHHAKTAYQYTPRHTPSTDARNFGVPFSGSDQNGAANDGNSLAKRPVVVLETLQEKLLQHFTPYFNAANATTTCSRMTSTTPTSTTMIHTIGNEEDHRQADKMLSLPSFFVALLLLQYSPVAYNTRDDGVHKNDHDGRMGKETTERTRNQISSSSLGFSEGGEEYEGEEEGVEGCVKSFGAGTAVATTAPPSLPPPELLDAHLERWNQLAGILTYGRMYDIDLTPLAEVDGGTQSVVLALIKELLGDVEKSVWAQIHHPSWWDHFSFPSLLSVCRGISLFSYTWVAPSGMWASPIFTPWEVDQEETSYIPDGIRLLLIYLQSSMRKVTQSVCDMALRQEKLSEKVRDEAENAKNGKEQGLQASRINERSLHAFSPVATRDGNMGMGGLPSSPASSSPTAAFPIGSVGNGEEPLFSLFLREAEETLNSYLALYAHVCGVFIELDVNGAYNAGELLFLPFSLQDEEGNASSHSQLTPGQWAAVDALFSSPFSCSCSYAPPHPGGVSTFSSATAPSVYIPLLPKFMLFLQHVLQSPRLEQHLSKLSPDTPSFFLEERTSPSASSLLPAVLSVTDGVFLEAACAILFSMLSVVSFIPENDAPTQQYPSEEVHKQEKKKGVKSVLKLLETASGGAPLVVLLQRLFTIYTVLSKPKVSLLSRLFTCVERCFRELSLASSSSRTLAASVSLYPGQSVGTSFSTLAAKTLLSPSLLQHLGEYSGSVYLGVLHAHLYGLLTLHEMKRKSQRLQRGNRPFSNVSTSINGEVEEEQQQQGLPIPYQLASFSSSTGLSISHLLGCLTYLPPGQLSHYQEVLTFYLTVLRYICSLETTFSAVEVAYERKCSKDEEERTEVKEETQHRDGGDGISGGAFTRVEAQIIHPGSQKKGKIVRKKLERRRVMQWWWWWIEEDASRILLTYPSLIGTLMEAAAVLQGRISAGYLYGVEGPLQGALERTWRIIAVLTTNATSVNAYALLSNTVVPVAARTTLLTGYPISPSPLGNTANSQGRSMSNPLSESSTCSSNKGTTDAERGPGVFSPTAPDSTSSSLEEYIPHPYSHHYHTSDIPAFTLLLEVVFSSSAIFHPQIQLICASLWCASLKYLSSSSSLSSCSSGIFSKAHSNAFHVLRLALGTTASRLLASLRSFDAGVERSNPHQNTGSSKNGKKGYASDDGKRVIETSEPGSSGLLERLLGSLDRERGEVSNVLRLQVLLALQRFDSRLFMQFFLAPYFAAASAAAGGAVPSSLVDPPSSQDEEEGAARLTSLADLSVVQLLQQVVLSPLPSLRGTEVRKNRKKRQHAGNSSASSASAHPHERALAWFLLLGMKLSHPSFFPRPHLRKEREDASRDEEELSSILFPFSSSEEVDTAPELVKASVGKKIRTVKKDKSVSGAVLYQAAAALHFWLSIWLREKQQEGDIHTPFNVNVNAASDPSSIEIGKVNSTSSKSSPGTSEAASLLIKTTARSCDSFLEQDKEVLWYVVVKGVEQLEVIQEELSSLHHHRSLYRRDVSLDWWRQHQINGPQGITMAMKSVLSIFSSSSFSCGVDEGESFLSLPADDDDGVYTGSTAVSYNTGGGGCTSLLLYPLVLQSCFSSSSFSACPTNCTPSGSTTSRIENEFLLGLPAGELETWNRLASLLYSLQSYFYALEKSFVFLHCIEKQRGEVGDENGEDGVFPQSSKRYYRHKNHRRRWISVVLVELVSTLMEVAGGSPLPPIAWLQQACVKTCLGLLHTLTSIGFLTSSNCTPFCLSNDLVDVNEKKGGESSKRVLGKAGESTAIEGAAGVIHPSSLSSPGLTCFAPLPSRLLSVIRFLVFDFLPKQPARSTVIVTNILILLRSFPLGSIFDTESQNVVKGVGSKSSGFLRNGKHEGEEEEENRSRERITEEEWYGWGNLILRQVMVVIAAQFLYFEKEKKEMFSRRCGGERGWERPGFPSLSSAQEQRRRERFLPRSKLFPSGPGLPCRREWDETVYQGGEEGKSGRQPDHITFWESAREEEKEAFIEAANVFFISHENAMQPHSCASYLSGSSNSSVNIGKMWSAIPYTFAPSLRTITVCLIHSLEELADHIYVWGGGSTSNMNRAVASFTTRIAFLQTLLRVYPVAQGYVDKSVILALGGALGQLVWMPPVLTLPSSSFSPPCPHPSSSSMSALAPLPTTCYQRCAAQELWCALLELCRTLLLSGSGGGGNNLQQEKGEYDYSSEGERPHPDSVLHPSVTGWMEVLRAIIATPRFHFALSGFLTHGTVMDASEGKMSVNRSGGGGALFVWDMEEWYLCTELVSAVLAMGCQCFSLSAEDKLTQLVREAFQEVQSARLAGRFRASHSGASSSLSGQEEKVGGEGEEDENPLSYPSGVEHEEPLAERTLVMWYSQRILRDQLYFLLLHPTHSAGMLPAQHKASTTLLNCSWPCLFSTLYRYIARQMRMVVQQASFVFSWVEERGEAGEVGGYRDGKGQGNVNDCYVQCRRKLQRIFSTFFPHQSPPSTSSSSLFLTSSGQKDTSSQGVKKHLLGSSYDNTYNTSQRSENSLLHPHYHIQHSNNNTSSISNNNTINNNNMSSHNRSQSRSVSSCRRGYSLSPSRGYSTPPSLSRLPSLVEEISVSMESVDVALRLFFKGAEEILKVLHHFCPLGPQDALVDAEVIQFGRRLIHTLESIEKKVSETISSEELLYFLCFHRQQLTRVIEQLRVI